MIKKKEKDIEGNVLQRLFRWVESVSIADAGHADDYGGVSLQYAVVCVVVRGAVGEGDPVFSNESGAVVLRGRVRVFHALLSIVVCPAVAEGEAALDDGFHVEAAFPVIVGGTVLCADAGEVDGAVVVAFAEVEADAPVPFVVLGATWVLIAGPGGGTVVE